MQRFEPLSFHPIFQNISEDGELKPAAFILNAFQHERFVATGLVEERQYPIEMFQLAMIDCGW